MAMVRTAVLQFPSEPGQVDRNLQTAFHFLEKAAQRHAELAILPELCQSGYALTPETAAGAAEPVDGPTVERLSKFARARGMHIVAGMCEQAAGKLYNSAVLIGPEGLIGIYRKAHLFYREKEIFSPGDTGFPVFDLGWGRIAMLICYDLRFPEAIRMTALQGAELICVPTAWVAPAGPMWDASGFSMQAYCAMAHASMNRLYIACADTCGTWGEGIPFLGGSLIAGPAGWPAAGPSPVDRDDLLIADLDLTLARVKSPNPMNDLFRDRRTDLYGEFPVGLENRPC